ncbi:MAG: S9 family peptidase [Opitutaceae bacterium]|jgi:dipeptidyl aminopeptidase/acylaminoacyl peptidase
MNRSAFGFWPRRVLVIVAILLGSTDANRLAKAAEPQEAPLIDREIFFGNPEIAGAQVSPDGKYVTFLKPWMGTRNIWVKRVDEGFEMARRLTAETKRPIPGYMWSWDSKYVLYVKDRDGDENFNLYGVNPAEKPEEATGAPPSRNFTNQTGVRVVLYSVPKHEPNLVYIGLNNRDKAWHDLYRLKLDTGELTLVRQNTDRIEDWTFDLSGKLRLAMRSAENGDTEILRVDPDKLVKIYSCNVFETCLPLRFQKGDRRVYFESNRGADVNLISLWLLDPETGATDLVESDPLNRVDLDGATFSEATDEIAATAYEDDRLRRYYRDPGFAADHEWLQKQFPGMEVGASSRSMDEQVWLVTVYSDTEPGQTYLFDRRTHRLAFQFRIRENLPRASLCQMKAVRYPSSDGLEIPAYLTLPAGPGTGLPALVIPHGGPWARDSWAYNTLAQFFANRGYAVLMPNFRGSIGYGKKFLDSGNREWGRKMQDDVTWGVKYLVAKGIADPKRVGILGASYGGYATLAGLTFTPDLYAAGVDIVGPSNLITLMKSIPPYWESERKLFYERMGDPTTPEGRTLLNDRSPLTFADRIRTPLLVAQGANDPRVNRSESERIVVALRDRGFPVEYIMAPDEGHGFQRPINNLALFMETEWFLAKYLGGRFQVGGSPESVRRLAEIMVDPATVKLSKAPDAAASASAQP